jgi:hypothetical protein
MWTHLKDCDVLQVLMWLLAMLCGMVLGKLLIHGYVCGKLLRLKMFRDDQVSVLFTSPNHTHYSVCENLTSYFDPVRRHL